MLNFEEELAQYTPIDQTGDVEKLIQKEPLVDLTDIMKEMLEKAQEVKEG